MTPCASLSFYLVPLDILLCACKFSLEKGDRLPFVLPFCISYLGIPLCPCSVSFRLQPALEQSKAAQAGPAHGGRQHQFHFELGRIMPGETRLGGLYVCVMTDEVLSFLHVRTRLLTTRQHNCVIHVPACVRMRHVFPAHTKHMATSRRACTCNSCAYSQACCANTCLPASCDFLACACTPAIQIHVCT